MMAGYLYGGFARGNSGPQHDLDLAILLPAGGQLGDKLDLIGGAFTVCAARC